MLQVGRQCSLEETIRMHSTIVPAIENVLDLQRAPDSTARMDTCCARTGHSRVSGFGRQLQAFSHEQPGRCPCQTVFLCKPAPSFKSCHMRQPEVWPVSCC
jgi:hypothetical protein